MKAILMSRIGKVLKLQYEIELIQKEILKLLSEEQHITEEIRKKIPHTKLYIYFAQNELIEMNYIEMIKSERKFPYRITPTGLNYLQKLMQKER